MKILTALEMREIDARTIEAGLPELILMEGAAHRVVEQLHEHYAPLAHQRIVIFAGKGNNGGDGLAIARLLHTRFSPRALDVIVPAQAHPQLTLLLAAGFPPTSIHSELPPHASLATLVLDALLGTGLTGPPRPPYAEAIATINTAFPLAQIIAIDLPSGMNADTGLAAGPVVHAHRTITFTAPKRAHLLGENLGPVTVGQIGTPPAFLADCKLEENEPPLWRHLLAPRAPESHKGTYGHVLAIGGSPGKSGAIAMTGLAALRMGAGRVTVASSQTNLPYPELMSAALSDDWAALPHDSLALGPGLDPTDPRIPDFIQNAPAPMVVDADALNALAGQIPTWFAAPRVFTPHPGEMARLLGRPVADRIADAQDFAAAHNVILVLKGHRTVIAHPDGRTVINPTGSPAMATPGSGDILTGLLATLLAQADDAWDATLAAVYLHGLAGQLAAAELTEPCVIATDLLRFLPEAIRRCA